MKREDAIKKLLCAVRKDILIKAVLEMAQKETRNYPLQLLNAAFKITDDTNNNWFTALGVLCIHQKVFVGRLIQAAYMASGNSPLSGMTKAELIDAIASGSKLTKADAG